MGLGGEAQQLKKEFEKDKTNSSDSEALAVCIAVIMPIVVSLMMFVTNIIMHCVFDLKYTEVFIMNLFPCDLGICIIYMLAFTSIFVYDHLSGYFSPSWPKIVIPIGIILLGALIIVFSGYWDSQMQLHSKYVNHLRLR